MNFLHVNLTRNALVAEYPDRSFRVDRRLVHWSETAFGEVSPELVPGSRLATGKDAGGDSRAGHYRRKGARFDGMRVTRQLDRGSYIPMGASFIVVNCEAVYDVTDR